MTRILYIDAGGDNATAEIGNPSKPYSTAQAAFDAALAAAGNYLLKFGVGSFGTIVVPTGGWPARIGIAGAGYKLSSLTGIDGAGANGSNGSNHATIPTAGAAGEAGKPATIISDGSINLGIIDLSGGNGGVSGAYLNAATEATAGATGTNGAAGGAAGSLTLINAVYDEIILNGGNGSDGRAGQDGGIGGLETPSGDGGAGGNGGDAGAIASCYLHQCKCTAAGGGDITMKKGQAGAAGGGGNPGSDAGGGSGVNGTAGDAGVVPDTPAANIRVTDSGIGALDFDSTTGADQVMATTLFTSITIDGAPTAGVGADIGGNYESFEYHKLP